MAGFDPDVFGTGTAAPAGFDPEVFNVSASGKLTPKDTAPAAVKAGSFLNDTLPHQLGLTARYGLEGLANAAQIVTEPMRYFTDKLIPERQLSLGDLVVGNRRQPKSLPLGVIASNFADWIGLPTPQGANERVIGDATRLVAGAGGMGGAASAARGISGAVGDAAAFLSANMPQQLAAAAGAGLAGGASREAGGGPLAQGVAALAGGVAGGLAQGGVSSAIDSATGAVKGALNRLTPQQMDAQISAVLQRADVDYSALPKAAQAALRNDLASAMRAGDELSPEAVARLADFRATGLTPTRGMVSQDPVQVTREMNLAKIGANSSDGQLQGLPRIQNSNNAGLIRNLNDAGANQGNAFNAGQSAIGAIKNKDEVLAGTVTGLYQKARDTSGRSLPLDGSAFITKANQALDEAMLGGSLPQDVANHMNRIAKGEVPFTIDYAEQLKKRIGDLQRATNDGSARMALSKVRSALDETPLMPAPQVNPGNFPAVPGTVPQSPLTAGQESIDAFNAARTAARQRFGWQESGKPIEAALNGAEPDKFVQRFVIGGSVADARAIAQNAPTEEVKTAILAHLKDRALNGAADEVGKFSQSAFNKALRDIGDRKLALFFSPEEIGQLRAVGRVASYTQVQPVGSAVNNSNTGALMLGKGYDALMGLTSKVPGLGPLVVPPVRNIEIALRQRQAENILPGLLELQQRQVGQAFPGLLPGLAYGGSLAAP